MDAALNPAPRNTHDDDAQHVAHHHHAHDHAGHDHHHHHELARKASSFSLIALSGWARLGLVVPVLLLLWLLTFWAMANG